jgi:hypothetical protein
MFFMLPSFSFHYLTTFSPALIPAIENLPCAKPIIEYVSRIED